MYGQQCPVVRSNASCYWKEMWQRLNAMRHHAQLCDVKLATDDGSSFLAHSPVIAASSSLLHTKLVEQPTLSSQLGPCGSGSSVDCVGDKSLVIHGVSASVLKITLDFIYGNTPTTREEFVRLQEGVKTLEIQAGYKYCVKKLTQLDQKDAVQIDLSQKSRATDSPRPFTELPTPSHPRDPSTCQTGEDDWNPNTLANLHKQLPLPRNHPDIPSASLVSAFQAFRPPPDLTPHCPYSSQQYTPWRELYNPVQGQKTPPPINSFRALKLKCPFLYLRNSDRNDRGEQDGQSNNGHQDRCRKIPESSYPNTATTTATTNQYTAPTYNTNSSQVGLRKNATDNACSFTFNNDVQERLRNTQPQLTTNLSGTQVHHHSYKNEKLAARQEEAFTARGQVVSDGVSDQPGRAYGGAASVAERRTSAPRPSSLALPGDTLGVPPTSPEVAAAAKKLQFKLWPSPVTGLSPSPGKKSSGTCPFSGPEARKTSDVPQPRAKVAPSHRTLPVVRKRSSGKGAVRPSDILGAGLDMTPPPDHPVIELSLTDLTHSIQCPHLQQIASGTVLSQPLSPGDEADDERVNEGGDCTTPSDHARSSRKRNIQTVTTPVTPGGGPTGQDKKRARPEDEHQENSNDLEAKSGAFHTVEQSTSPAHQTNHLDKSEGLRKSKSEPIIATPVKDFPQDWANSSPSTSAQYNSNNGIAGDDINVDNEDVSTSEPPPSLDLTECPVMMPSSGPRSATHSPRSSNSAPRTCPFKELEAEAGKERHSNEDKHSSSDSDVSDSHSPRSYQQHQTTESTTHPDKGETPQTWFPTTTMPNHGGDVLLTETPRIVPSVPVCKTGSSTMESGGPGHLGQSPASTQQAASLPGARLAPSLDNLNKCPFAKEVEQGTADLTNADPSACPFLNQDASREQNSQAQGKIDHAGQENYDCNGGNPSYNDEQRIMRQSVEECTQNSMLLCEGNRPDTSAPLSVVIPESSILPTDQAATYGRQSGANSGVFRQTNISSCPHRPNVVTDNYQSAQSTPNISPALSAQSNHPSISPYSSDCSSSGRYDISENRTSTSIKSEYTNGGFQSAVLDSFNHKLGEASATYDQTGFSSIGQAQNGNQSCERVHGIRYKDDLFHCTFESCGFSHKQADTVKAHCYQKHQIGQPEYPCMKCDKGFFSESQLHGHIKRCHANYSAPENNNLDNSCVQCGEKFESSYKLQTHLLKVHGKGKLFTCDECSFKSPRKKDVQAHMLSQHKKAPQGVKVYSCSRCDYKCIDRNRHEEHEAMHTGEAKYACPQCGKSYTTRRGMRTHLLYHSESRPHRCDMCDASFKVRSKLRDHTRLIHTHPGVKPFKCGYCDHTTALRGNCNQHIRKHHPNMAILVTDYKANERRAVKTYDYAGMSGDGIEEVKDISAAKWASTPTTKSQRPGLAT